MIIRPFAEKDKEDVRFICLNSEGPCDLSESSQHFILTTYCDYYLEQEPENCFVAADGDDRAVGYVICAEDFDQFRACFNRAYLSRFPKYDFKHRLDARASVILHEKYKQTYPAHLHIDVLPEYQRRGLGHLLIQTLASHLSLKGVPGVMLTVWTKNTVGRSFYEKYGFTFLEDAYGSAAYGLPLHAEELADAARPQCVRNETSPLEI